MSTKERKLVKAVNEASGKLLSATDYATTYMARVSLASALSDLYVFSAEALERERAKGSSSYSVSMSP